jgi:endo-1,4-beta-mannosidase
VVAVGNTETYEITNLGRAVALGEVNTLLDMSMHVLSKAEWISSQLKELSTDSDHWEQFELIVQEAFQYLGFEALHIGGAHHDTDLLLTIQHSQFRAIVDTKVRGSKLVNLDSQTITDHRDLNGADYALVIAPAFAQSGKVVERATKNHITLLTAEQLGEIVTLHEKVSFSIEELTALFEIAGLVTQIPEPMMARCRMQEHIGVLLMSIIRLLDDMGCSNAGIQWTVESLHSALVIRSGEAYTLEDIQSAVALLTHPTLKALVVNENNTLSLAMSWDTFLSRLASFNQMLTSLAF